MLIFSRLRSLFQFCSFCKFLIFCRCCICPSCCYACCCIRLRCSEIYRSCALCWACALSALNELNVSCDTACFCAARATSASIFCRFAQRFDCSLFSELATSHLLASAKNRASLPSCESSEQPQSNTTKIKAEKNFNFTITS